MNTHAAVRVVLALALCPLLGQCRKTQTTTTGERAAPTPRPRPSEIVPDLALLNGASGGENLELAAHVVAGKTTLFEFYSRRCPHSAKMEPVMQYLAAHRDDLAIRQVDIDRPGAEEIDFESPLAEQYEVDATPSFRVYDANGALVASGDAAKDLVRDWYQQAQQFEHVDQLPGVAEQYERRE